jgi:S-adenosylmethionine synthetase
VSYLFTSESVSEGHPDKVADAISDVILDLMMREGNKAYRCACETLVTTNRVIIAGEYKGIYNNQEVENAVRRVIRDIGYKQDGFNWETVEITNLMHGQSADIALGTDTFGAGDQGLMFGYAINETPDLMPSAIYWSHKIVRYLTIMRKSKWTWLGPDAKSQVTMEYNDDGTVKRIAKIVCSTQHSADIDIVDVREIVKGIIKDIVSPELIDADTEFLINPTGRFVIGGPDGDTGLTGEKGDKGEKGDNVIIDSKNYTFCKECYDEGLCYECNSVDFNNDTIYNCDVCNKHLCSECYRESDNTGYCKDCFSNVSKNIE